MTPIAIAYGDKYLAGWGDERGVTPNNALNRRHEQRALARCSCPG
jgi:hypothetical protein